MSSDVDILLLLLLLFISRLSAQTSNSLVARISLKDLKIARISIFKKFYKALLSITIFSLDGLLSASLKLQSFWNIE